MKKYYRVTWEGFFDIEAENEEEAKQKFIEHIENEDIDDYGRTWQELIGVEEINAF